MNASWANHTGENSYRVHGEYDCSEKEVTFITEDLDFKIEKDAGDGRFSINIPEVLKGTIPNIATLDGAEIEREISIPNSDFVLTVIITFRGFDPIMFQRTL